MLAQNNSGPNPSTLWITDTHGKEPHMILYPLWGGTSTQVSQPQFSVDGKQIYFVIQMLPSRNVSAQLVATCHQIEVLDLEFRKVRPFCSGLAVEVLSDGYLLVLKEIPHVKRGIIRRHWWVDEHGTDISEVGDNEAAVAEFKGNH